MRLFPAAAERKRRRSLCEECPERKDRAIDLGISVVSYEVCGECGCSIAVRVESTCPKQRW